MQSTAKTVTQYLKNVPEKHLSVLSTMRKLVLENLPSGYVETMQYGMIGYVVPLSLYPLGYLDKKDIPLTYIGLASQKNYISLYLMNIYSSQDNHQWFQKAYKASGKKMNMGKSCVRFSKIEDLPLPLIAQAIAKTPVKKFIELYENSRKN